ncbi:pilus assembly protein FimT [Cupriavidus sp. SK-4]|uniref:GspH/FimT family pseudopilin n=1 Tax=Cupriavidus sp. SK-4 TaxID=574750 RepID=UPI00044EED87|nr:GspH/FimT family pseudopilin [Cupriavidus sp. SK-4]EYS91267.1 pilus assembly protein FimT [Cupriavidus sp. SK-4]
MRAQAPQPQTGFTLIELLVTLVVLVILAGMAAPAYTSFIQRNTLATEADALASSLSLARASALSRNSWVTVAPVSNDWRNGWTVCLNPNRNADCTGQTVLVQHVPSAQGLTVAFSSTPQSGILSYSPVGYTRTLADAMQSAQVLMGLGTGNQKLIDISQLGRVRVCAPVPTQATVCQ